MTAAWPMGIDGGDGPMIYPNSFGGPQPDPNSAEPPLRSAGQA
ncbi:MAG: hypothetical protein U5N58_06470 [Actinomycetota bacterium]|nr:hypothetical protein [Actinomycetota bacterium]